MEYFDILNEFGEFTGKVADRDTCHKEGFWHRAIYGFIINNDGDVLLQRRSKTKKLWPDLWDITAGGHVLTGEFGEQALIREVKEELGIEIAPDEVRYLVGSTSVNVKGDVINKHFNECYLIKKDINIDDITLQTEEVSDIKWFSKEDILNRINNDYDGITDKTGPWNFLKKYYEYINN